MAGGGASVAWTAKGDISALAEGFVEHHGPGGGDVEGADAAGHGNAKEMVAGAADQVVEAGSLAPKNEDEVAGEVEPIVVGGSALFEADDPEILALEVFECADEVDDAGDAEVFGGAGAGLDGDRAQRGGAALGEDHSVDAGAVGDAEERAEVLRIFDAIEGKDEAGGAGDGRRGGEEVLDGEGFLGADESYDALVGGGSGDMGQVLAGLLEDADSVFAALSDEFFKAEVVAFASHQHVVEAPPAGLEGLFHRMQAVENFHGAIVEDWPRWTVRGIVAVNGHRMLA